MKFLIRQLIKFVLLMLAVSVIVFVLVDASPIDPVQANIGQAAYLNMSEERRALLEAYWGADTPVWERYLSWMSSVLQGDLGTSLRYNAPVVEVIANRALNSLVLMFIAWVASGILGFALGLVAAVYRGRLVDRIIKAYCYVLASIPTFWLGLVFLVVFAVYLGWFPVGFSVPIGVAASDVTIADLAYHLVLPALTLSVLGVANIALHTREKAIDVLESDYARFACARGLTTGAFLRRHGLRNLVLPAITLQCASISEIFGGSVLVEQVFSYPGLGQAAVTAGLGSDVELLAGIALFSAALVFGGNLLANILYGCIDPRMRGGQRRSVRGRRAQDVQAAQVAQVTQAAAGHVAQVADVVRTAQAADVVHAAQVADIASDQASSQATCQAQAAALGDSSSLGGLASVDDSPDVDDPSSLSAPETSSKPPELVSSESISLLLHQARQRRFANRRVTLIACVASALALAAIVVGGLALADTAAATDFSIRNLVPSLEHLFGTDWMGRDMLARTLAGLSTSVLVGLLAAGCSALIALVLGSVAALGGKRADAVITWIIDVVMGLPHIVLLVLISFALGRGFWGVTIGVALTHWPSLARVVRAEVLQCKQAHYVTAARQLGIGRARIAFTHVLPYVAPQFIVGLILLFPHAILHEASVTFLGFGLSAEQPAIGIILSESMSYLSAGMWWLAVFPGLALVATVLLFDLVGSSLRKLLDPHRAQE